MTNETRYLLAFIVPFVATVALTPVAGRVARRVGLVDQPTGHRSHRLPTPTLGGAAVVGGLLLVAAVASGAKGELVVILLCAVFLGAVGVLDDLGGLSPVLRLAAEAACGVALWLVGVQAGVFGVPALDFVVTVVWVVAMVNAVNMVDNMDGLAGGVSFVAALGIALVAAGQGHFHTGSFALAVAGASAGFLCFNFPPARIFLGDAGSMALGFFLAALSLHLDLAVSSTLTRGLTIVLLVAVPLFDMTLVVLARLIRRHPPWLGATDHTSHRMAFGGMGRTGIALAFIAAQAVCTAAALLVRAAAEDTVEAMLVVTGAVWVAGLVLLLRMPYPEPDEVRSGRTTAVVEIPTTADVDAS